jgi:hypothetical protein
MLLLAGADVSCYDRKWKHDQRGELVREGHWQAALVYGFYHATEKPRMACRVVTRRDDAHAWAFPQPRHQSLVHLKSARYT